jgi:hypothetical protein
LYGLCITLPIVTGLIPRVNRLEIEFVRRIGDTELLKQSAVRRNVLFSLEFAGERVRSYSKVQKRAAYYSVGIGKAQRSGE